MKFQEHGINTTEFYDLPVITYSQLQLNMSFQNIIKQGQELYEEKGKDVDFKKLATDAKSAYSDYESGKGNLGDSAKKLYADLQSGASHGTQGSAQHASSESKPSEHSESKE